MRLHLQVPNGPLDKDGLDQALAGSVHCLEHPNFFFSFSDAGGSQDDQGNGSSQQQEPPPVVIVPGLQSRGGERHSSEPRRATSLWLPGVMLRGGHAKFWSHKPGLGRAGMWQSKLDPGGLSRAGSAGDQPEVGYSYFIQLDSYVERV